MTDQQPPKRPEEMSEAELRAAYEQQMEEQLRSLRVEDVVVQTIVTLVNLGGRRAGLAPGTEDERDPAQLRLAIEGARALLGLIEGDLGPDAGAIREALSQLQLAYAQLAGGDAPQGGGTPGSPTEPEPPKPSGRIWVPGQ